MIKNLARQIVRAARERRPVVIIDGGSGAGKTTLATQLALRLRRHWPGLQLVSLDQIYPGWHGLAAASDAVTRDVLREVNPGFRRWNWVTSEPSDWVALDPHAPIIIEGCGSLALDSAPLASTSIWVEMPADERKRRALERDGDGFRPYWDAWATQEAAHWAANQPKDLAHLVIERSVDGYRGAHEERRPDIP